MGPTVAIPRLERRCSEKAKVIGSSVSRRPKRRLAPQQANFRYLVMRLR